MRTLAGISLLLLIGMLLGASMLVYSAYVLLAVFWLSRYLSRRWTNALYATRTLSAIPGANNVEVMHGVGHSPMLEAPQRLAEIYVNFITQDFGEFDAN